MPLSKEFETKFSRYQIHLLILLTMVYFTSAIDFMIMAPLGIYLLKDLGISTVQFGISVSAYAFSAAIAGIIGASFTDKYQRKQLLLFMYGGLILGTLACGLANNFILLVISRSIAGAFGGTTSALVLTIIGDAFNVKIRGRAMGVVMTAFSLSQVAGIPLGLFLANEFDWHMPFLAVTLFGIFTIILVIIGMKTMNNQAKKYQNQSYFQNLFKILLEPRHITAFLANALVTMSGYLMIPYFSSYIVKNMGVATEKLPLMYTFIGCSTLVIMPLTGRITDKIGALKMFILGTLFMLIMLFVFINLTHISFPVFIIIQMLMFSSFSMRNVPLNTMMTDVPLLENRGGFLSASASLQQLGGGLASVIGGLITHQQADGSLLGFERLTYIAMGIAVLATFSIIRVNKELNKGPI